MQPVGLREDVHDARGKWMRLDRVARALRFRAALIKAGLRQRDIIPMCELSQSLVSMYANARSEMPWARWLLFAKLTDVPMDWDPTPDLMHRAWEGWKEEHEKRSEEPFEIPEPPKPSRKKA